MEWAAKPRLGCCSSAAHVYLEVKVSTHSIIYLYRLPSYWPLCLALIFIYMLYKLSFREGVKTWSKIKANNFWDVPLENIKSSGHWSGTGRRSSARNDLSSPGSQYHCTLYCTTLHFAVQCTSFHCAVQCTTFNVVHYTVQCSTLNWTVQCNALQCAVQYTSVQCNALQCVVNCTTVCSAMQCNSLCSAVHYITLCIAVHCKCLLDFSCTRVHRAGGPSAARKTCLLSQ